MNLHRTNLHHTPLQSRLVLRTPRLLLLLSLLLCILAGCGSGAGAAGAAGKPKGGGEATPFPTLVPPIATPTVDIAHAREVFQSGGELAYEEVLALRLDLVGDPSKMFKSNDSDQIHKAEDEYGPVSIIGPEMYAKAWQQELVGNLVPACQFLLGSGPILPAPVRIYK